jgi:ABC-type transport system involved in cytochrome c biogenesis permease component
VSIPFILVAFNQDKISAWAKRQKKGSIIWILFFVLVIILLSIIWTRDLASGMKAAVTVAVVLLIVAGVIARVIYWAITWGTGQLESSSDGSRSVIDVD